MRLRPAQRLTRSADIRRVREKGRRIDCQAFTLWWKIRETEAAGTTPEPAGKADAPARVCVIASTAAVGPAVRRNRAKRRMREMFRLHQDDVPRNCDLLLIARASATTWPLPELERRFTEACRRINA